MDTVKINTKRGILAPLFLATALLVVTVDLTSKWWAFTYISENAPSPAPFDQRVPVIDGFFYLAKVRNTGTIWGLGQGRTGLLRIVRLIMVLVLLWLAWDAKRTERLKLVALGLVLGGALGNLVDNFTQHDMAVRDFLDFYIPLPWLDKPYHYPTFNVADSAILIGAILLFWAFSRESPREEAAEEVKAEVATEDGERG